MRIGDADRETAMQALGDHMSAGRITLDEYGERSAQVTAAKTRGELADLFTDLPAPHPVFGEPPKQPVATPKPAGPVPYSERPLGQRAAAAILPLLFIGAVVLGLTTHVWWFIALPFVFGAIGQGLWGKDWDKDARRDRDRGHRRR
ncbi:DUF1707 domain-containing protein [Amycolatopsis sp. RM579]|uniref:DUF1707 domain-containing protein n=2 Tax=Amycolatopsis pithecellobii TaxID=664692 RepID=A0A6N7ZBC1_9PSEU|nr:DUF1707 domain-containing protein [Amycolatopsis pithecellobii]